jgi:AcrR family transcriptional regulator
MGRVAAAKHKDYAQARQDAILHAALRIFAQEGFAEATMDQVAATADLSKAALYIYPVGPVRVPPLESRAGARVRRWALLCAVLRRAIAAIHVKKDSAEVCPLSREMMSAHRLNPYPPVTGRHSLPPPSSARIRLSLPRGRPASNRREYGFTVFRPSDSRAV